MALGNFDGRIEINVSGNSQSSSILEMNETHLNTAPASKYIGKEIVEIRTLNSLFKELNISDRPVYMKIDTQGFEKNVLLGANSFLNSIKAVQLEMSVQPLYQGEELYYQLSDYLYQGGFRLVKIVRGLTKSDGELLQFDGVFMRD